MTHRIDVTKLKHFSESTNTKFYINFLYVLCKALNSRDDCKMVWQWQTNELLCYDVINPTQYIFHEDTETFTVAYTKYSDDYKVFYENAMRDAENAKKTRKYGLDSENHPNWFDASFLPWLSYDSLNIELPDGYLYFQPIVNWGKYEIENSIYKMPVSVRMNHAICDGYLISKVFSLIEAEIEKLSE